MLLNMFFSGIIFNVLMFKTFYILFIMRRLHEVNNFAYNCNKHWLWNWKEGKWFLCSASEVQIIVLYYNVLYYTINDKNKPCFMFSFSAKKSDFPSVLLSVVPAETTVVEYRSSISVLFFYWKCSKIVF